MSRFDLFFILVDECNEVNYFIITYTFNETVLTSCACVRGNTNLFTLQSDLWNRHFRFKTLINRKFGAEASSSLKHFVRKLIQVSSIIKFHIAQRKWILLARLPLSLFQYYKKNFSQNKKNSWMTYQQLLQFTFLQLFRVVKVLIHRVISKHLTLIHTEPVYNIPL